MKAGRSFLLEPPSPVRSPVASADRTDLQENPGLRDLDRAILPAWAWRWFPLAFVVSIPLARILAPGFHEQWLNPKEGPIEWATALTLLVGIVAGWNAWRRRAGLPARWLQAWLLFLVLGTTYFALEEVSWGQTLLCWSSPEVFASWNGQGETNLHNASSWFNEKPRVLVEIFVLVGGVLVPLRWARRRLGWDDWRAWFWPTRLTVPVAVAALVVRVPDRWEKLAGRFEGSWLADLRLSEPQELLFAWFLTLLLCSFAVRLGSSGPGRA